MSTAIYYVQINVTCILILGLLLLSIPKYNIKTLRSVLFNIMLVTTIIYCFSDLFAGLFRGATFSGARAILWISNILYSTSMLTLAFTWILFSSAVLRGKIDRWLIGVAGGAFAIIVIMNLLTPLTGMIFYIDGDNLYHRNDTSYNDGVAGR